MILHRLEHWQIKLRGKFKISMWRNKLNELSFQGEGVPVNWEIKLVLFTLILFFHIDILNSPLKRLCAMNVHYHPSYTKTMIDPMHKENIIKKSTIWKAIFLNVSNTPALFIWYSNFDNYLFSKGWFPLFKEYHDKFSSCK